MKHKILTVRSLFALAVLLALLLSSCTTVSYMQIEVLEPAEVSLPGKVKTLGVIDNTKNHKPYIPLASKIASEPDPDRFKKDTIVAEASMDGFIDIVLQSPRYEIFIVDDSIINKMNFLGALSEMEWNYLKSMAADSSLDAFAVLVAAEAYDPLDIKYEALGDAYYQYTVFTYNTWEIIDPFKQYTLDKNTNFDTIYQFSEVGFFDVFFTTYKPDREEMVPAAAYWTGEAYGMRIAPLWEEVDRKYYGWNSDASKKATQYVRLGNWEEAAEIWNMETLNKKAGIASKACYNMAVASELLDNLDLAKLWLEKSLAIKYSTSADIYLDILEKRLSKRKLIEYQMSGK